MSDRLPLLLYDGTCGFCNATVQLILRYDRKGILRFAALESTRGRGILAEHPELEGVDSVVWVEKEGARTGVVTRSAATLRVAAYLGGVWRLALVGEVIPAPVRDWLYDLIARHRHRLISGAARCVIPPAEARHRFEE